MALFIAFLYAIRFSSCWATFSATKYASNSGFLISFIFTETSELEILLRLFFILSISDPFFPITKPGLDVKIVTIHFLVGLSIKIFEIPEFLRFLWMYSLILKSSIKYCPYSFFLANHIESQFLLILNLKLIGLTFCPIIYWPPPELFCFLKQWLLN